MNIINVANYIFDLIDFGKDDRPDIFTFDILPFGLQGTCYNNDSNTLFIDCNEAKDILLFKLFHECWHARQTKIGINLKYDNEDRLKYAYKPHMMMLYKYDFEAEASGYASAFVYTLYKLTNRNGCNLNKIIEDKYDNCDCYPESEFDTYDDYININKKIDSYYEKGKMYFQNLLKNSLNKDVLELINDKENKLDENLLYLISQKGFIFYKINDCIK